jgi:hypothetical protein
MSAVAARSHHTDELQAMVPPCTGEQAKPVIAAEGVHVAGAKMALILQ